MITSHHVECELKLSTVSTEESTSIRRDIERFLALHMLAANRKRTVTYFDAGSLLLDSNRSLRGSKKDHGFSYVYKTPVETSTQMTVRQEISIESEAPLDFADPFTNHAPALVDLHDLLIRAQLRPHDLAPALVIGLERELSVFHDRINGVPFVGYVCLDQVTAQLPGGERSEVFHEVEIELTKIYPSSIKLVEEIAVDLKARGYSLNNRCKYAAGRALVCPT